LRLQRIEESSEAGGPRELKRFRDLGTAEIRRQPSPEMARFHKGRELGEVRYQLKYLDSQFSILVSKCHLALRCLGKRLGNPHISAAISRPEILMKNPP